MRLVFGEHNWSLRRGGHRGDSLRAVAFCRSRPKRAGFDLQNLFKRDYGGFEDGPVLVRDSSLT